MLNKLQASCGWALGINGMCNSLNSFNCRHYKQAKDADKLEPKGVVDKLTCSSLMLRNLMCPRRID